MRKPFLHVHFIDSLKMGILGLFDMLRKETGTAIKQTTISNYAGATVGIDISSFMYKWIYLVGDDPEALEKNALDFIVFFLQNEIIPICVFDGSKIPPGKAATLLARKKRREAVQIKISAAQTQLETLEAKLVKLKAHVDVPVASDTEVKAVGDQPGPPIGEQPRPTIGEQPVSVPPVEQPVGEKPIEVSKPIEKVEELITQKHLLQADLKKYNTQVIKVLPRHIEPIMAKFKEYGIPMIVAEYEADFVLNKLAKENMVGYLVADDGDLLVDMPPHVKLLRQVNKHRFGTVEIDEYDKATILLELGIEQDQFRELCILLGCDYCDRIPGYGIVRNLKLIRSYTTIEVILDQEKRMKKNTPKDYMDFVKTSRKYFQTGLGEDDLEPLKSQLKNFKIGEVYSRITSK